MRTSDYYWSLNEFYDVAVAGQLFQNTGRKIPGSFNMTGDRLQQGNDSIYNASTWYTVKFDQSGDPQCLRALFQNAVNHSCVIDPSNCTDGLTVEIWGKFSPETLRQTQKQILISAGSVEGDGQSGYYLYHKGQEIGAHVANGTHYQEVSYSNALTQPNIWTNIAIRYSPDSCVGLQVFMNGKIVAESVEVLPKLEKNLAADDNVRLGCRGVRLEPTQDYSSAEIDEPAIWTRYLPNNELEKLIGAIIDVDDPVYDYPTSASEIVLNMTSPTDYNPHYQLASCFIPCDGSVLPSSAVVESMRGHGSAIDTALLSADTTICAAEAVSNLASLSNGLSVAFWVQTDAASTAGTILQSDSWKVSLDADRNFVVEVTYMTVDNMSEPTGVFSMDMAVAVRSDPDMWSNIAFSWSAPFGLRVYCDGVARPENVSTSVSASDPGASGTLKLNQGGTSFNISDIAIWKRYIYEFERSKFMGVPATQLTLSQTMDFMWTTDYWQTGDQQGMGTWRPMYVQKTTTAGEVTPTGGPTSTQGRALLVDGETGWVLLGSERAESIDTVCGTTCMTEPSSCAEGLTVAMRINLKGPFLSSVRATIIDSGEGDAESHGFSIYMHEGKLKFAVADGTSLWKKGLESNQFVIGTWMHVAFSWKLTEGLWIYINGEPVVVLPRGIDNQRNTNRYNRITLGRSNANSLFGSYSKFETLGVVATDRFMASYEVRAALGLPANKFYEEFNHYWSKNDMISGHLTDLQAASAANYNGLGPHGNVVAHNAFALLTHTGHINIARFSGHCIVDPSLCPDGLTVGTWARVLEGHGEDTKPVVILSSNTDAADVLSRSKSGWVMYVQSNMPRILVVSGDKVWNVSLSSAAKPFRVGRWYNWGFTWAAPLGVTLYMDSIKAGIMKLPYSVNPAATAPGATTLTAGRLSAGNNTLVAIYNVVALEEYIFASSAHRLMGHEVGVAEKYAESEYMWTFDGPIGDLPLHTPELAPLTYDEDRTTAAMETSDGGGFVAAIRSANLGDLTGECITEPSTCPTGFQIGMELKLSDYDPNADKPASVAIVGSPDVMFQGFCMQQSADASGTNFLYNTVADDERVYIHDLQVNTSVTMNVVVGWNTVDGIDVKIDNIKRYGLKYSTIQETATLDHNYFLLGQGTGGRGTQSVNAVYDNIYIRYSDNVGVEGSERSYPEVKAHYRLAEGQIFTSEGLTYNMDRESVPTGAYEFSGNGYVELDDFSGLCFSEPSECTNGLTMALYVYIDSHVNNPNDTTILSTGYPRCPGVSIETVNVPGDNLNRKVRCTLNDGTNTYSLLSEPLRFRTWKNIGLLFNKTTGFEVFIDGQSIGKLVEANATVEILPASCSFSAMTIGKPNWGTNSNSNGFRGRVDDVALWDKELPVDDYFPFKLGGRPFIVQSLEQTGDRYELENAFSVSNQTHVEELGIGGVPEGCEHWIAEESLCFANDAEALAGLARFSEEQEGRQIEFPALQQSMSTILQRLEGFSTGSDTDSSEGSDAGNGTVAQLTVDAVNETILYLSEVAAVMGFPPDSPQHETFAMIETVTDFMGQLVSDQTEAAWEELAGNGPLVTDVTLTLHELELQLIATTVLGTEARDDCTKTCSQNPNVATCATKRRLLLCDEQFIFPNNDVLTSQEGSEEIYANMTALPSMIIDSSAWSRDESPDDATVSGLVNIYHNPQGVFPTTNAVLDREAETSEDGPRPNVIMILASAVMSVSTLPQTPNPMVNGSVQISMPLNTRNPMVGGRSRRVHCVFWNYAIYTNGAWDTQGCAVTQSNETTVLCECNHLTSFTILMEPLEFDVVDQDKIMQLYITYAGLGLSIFCLIIFLFLLIGNKTLRSERALVHINLVLAMIFASISFLLIDIAKYHTAFCRGLSISMHLFYTAVSVWMFLESLTLSNAVIYGKQYAGKIRQYIFVGWLIPIVVVGVTIVMRFEFYGDDNGRCWLSYDNYVILAFLGPILAFILLNGAMVFIILCNLPQPGTKNEEILKDASAGVKGTVFIVLYFGCTWSLALMTSTKGMATNVMFTYVFVAMNSLQGLVICLVYGVGLPSVRNAILHRRSTSASTESLVSADSPVPMPMHHPQGLPPANRAFVSVKPSKFVNPPSKRPMSKGMRTPSPLPEKRDD